MCATRRPPKKTGPRQKAATEKDASAEEAPARPRSQKATTPPRKDFTKQAAPAGSAKKSASAPRRKNAGGSGKKSGAKGGASWSKAAARRGKVGSSRPPEKPSTFAGKKAGKSGPAASRTSAKPASKKAAAEGPKLSAALKKRLAAIRLLILDVDGTLTDGTVWLGETEELKGFHIADGLGLKALMRCGVEVAIITGRTSEAVRRRAAELGIEHVFQKTRDKTRCVGILKRRLGLEENEVASMGDDLPDFQLFNACGFNFAVADAAAELREAADIVTAKAGGRGAAREAAELILKARGEWDAVVERFRKS